MTLRHLQIFKSVCTHMSITQAANELNMTQPAVSIAIKELEVFYNTKLFDRIGRKIYLTEMGEKLRSYTDTIIEQFDSSIADIRDESNLVTCHIGVNVTIGEGQLSTIIEKLKMRMPQLKLHVTVDNNKAIENMLANNQIDFAITDTPTNAHNLVISKLYSEEMQVVCSPRYTAIDSVTVKELSEMALLLREKGSGCRKCIDAVFEAVGCFPTPTVQSISNQTLINLVKNNHGLTILPTVLVKEYIKSGILKNLSLTDGKFIRDYYLVYQSKKFLSSVVLSCVKEIERLYYGEWV